MVTSSLTLNLDTIHLTDEQFYQLCQNNRELNFERTAKGELIIMSPVGGETELLHSVQDEAELIADLEIWNRQINLSVTFSSDPIFKLPNGANRSPDAAWIQRERWEHSHPNNERRKFPPIAPDFAIELRSATDDLEMLRSKMQEYMDAGVQLGWLINPQQQQVEIYRARQDVEVRNLPTELSSENILLEFRLNLSLY
ncbi:Uma2 family endonuclease [Microcoleus sp. N9_B2]